ncbi:MAG: OadG family protein [Anaerolineaceae bacterium]|nr:OadG family protein [Anaerolineaceae bacterium]
MALISQGLTLSLVGIAATFMSLGLFILSIYALRWLFPVEKRGKAEQTPEESGGDMQVVERGKLEEEEAAAVISAALSVKQFLQSRSEDVEEASAVAAAAMFLQQQPVMCPQKRQGLGDRLEESHGRWWQPMNPSSGDSTPSQEF